MKISTRGRYSLRLMIDLAQHYGTGLVTLNEVSTRQGISKKYLEQIIPFLTRSGLLVSTKGQQGGYSLSRSPDKINAMEILSSAEGNLYPVACMECDPINCEKAGECLTLPIYQGLYKVIDEYLSSLSLADIIAKSNDSFDYII